MSLYRAIARQDWESVRILEDANPTVRTELTTWGLVDNTNTKWPVALDPNRALQRRAQDELEDARRRVELLSQIPALAERLHQDYEAVRLRAGGTSSSEYLADPAVVNARIREVVGGARREILAAQPGGPREQAVLELAVERDNAALDRGVELRTIYRDTVRDHPVTAEYARTMSTRASGHPAKYRTLVGDFERMVIVDRQSAFVSDHIVVGSPPHSAWLITDPAAVSVLAAVYDSTWRRAQPWSGELRPGRGRSGPDTAGVGGVRTSRDDREVMRMLCAGVSQTSTAKKLGVSKRKLEGRIAALKGLWGVRTLNELIFQYALSPDRLVDDSDPAVDVTTGSAA